MSYLSHSWLQFVQFANVFGVDVSFSRLVLTVDFVLIVWLGIHNLWSKVNNQVDQLSLSKVIFLLPIVKM